MIFKNLTALCRAHKRIYLYGDPEGVQWVGDGGALYPLHGMPGMVEDDLQAVFDVPEKDEGKYLIDQHWTLPEIFCYKDVDPRGETQLRPEPFILKRYDTILCPVQTSQGLRFYNPDYLKPLKDLQNTLEIYERHTEGGQLYFAVKSGMLLQAIILPLAPDYGKILDELLTLCQALQQTVESAAGERAAEGGGPYEEDAEEIEGQIGMEEEE
jgi:hypothetical protein